MHMRIEKKILGKEKLCLQRWNNGLSFNKYLFFPHAKSLLFDIAQCIEKAHTKTVKFYFPNFHPNVS